MHEQRQHAVVGATGAVPAAVSAAAAPADAVDAAETRYNTTNQWLPTYH